MGPETNKISVLKVSPYIREKKRREITEIRYLELEGYIWIMKLIRLIKLVHKMKNYDLKMH